jgi:hypothetical protein
MLKGFYISTLILAYVTHTTIEHELDAWKHYNLGFIYFMLKEFYTSTLVLAYVTHPTIEHELDVWKQIII